MLKKWSRIETFATEKEFELEWKFIPPRAPHVIVGSLGSSYEIGKIPFEQLSAVIPILSKNMRR